MAGRPKIIRKISVAPVASGFRPYGMVQNAKKKESLFLLYEEYEALRLCDYEKYTQEEASSFMNVSRPTLTRIYMSAREKIAQAFVEGRNIIIEGGKVCFDSEWYTCGSCNCFFNNPFKETQLEVCPLCGSRDIQNFESLSEEEKSEFTYIGKSGCGRGHCSNKRKRGRMCQKNQE
jgi:uncharacterized protein